MNLKNFDHSPCAKLNSDATSFTTHMTHTFISAVITELKAKLGEY